MSLSGQVDTECAEKADGYEYHRLPSSTYPSLVRKEPLLPVSTPADDDEHTLSRLLATTQHLATIPFGFLLFWFRQNNVPLFGRKVDLICGVPAECFIWTIAILDLARREITSSLRRR